MKAITLWQPWAQLVASQAKLIETRSWETSYRGPLAIHAAKRRPEHLRVGLAPDPIEVATLAGPGDRLYVRGQTVTMPLGAVVAVANLLDCVPTEAVCEIDDQRVDGWFWIARSNPHHEAGYRVGARSSQFAFGDFRPGRWAWLLDMPAPMEPVPATGHQRLWDWKGTP